MDRDRVLAKLDEMDGYLGELRTILPADIVAYRAIEKRRACERLLQVSVECALDVCHQLVAGRRLGLPGAEEDVLDKLETARLLSHGTVATLRRMKGCRNILVHEYGHVLDELIFEAITTRLDDFEHFKQDVLQALKLA